MTCTIRDMIKKIKQCLFQPQKLFPIYFNIKIPKKIRNLMNQFS